MNMFDSRISSKRAGTRLANLEIKPQSVAVGRLKAVGAVVFHHAPHCLDRELGLGDLVIVLIGDLSTL
jgi:hypothetical protein